jgi:hypothetical protein
MPSPGQNPGALNHAIEGWGPGVGSRRDPPQLLKGSRTFGVAAGGCPALPSGEGGVRASCPRVRAWGRVVPGPPTGWVAGLTADLPRCRPRARACGGEAGRMRGSLRVEVLRAPAASRWSGEPRPRKNTPCGGLAVLRALDNYRVFTGRFSMRSSSSPHPRARPASGSNGGYAYPGEWRGVQGSPGGEGAR